MRNFQLIAQGVDVLPLLHAVQVQPKLWNQYSLRTMYPQSPHHQAEDIWIRFNEINVENPLSAVNDKECRNYDAFYALPQVRPILFDLMRRVEGEQLGRVLITKLAPGNEITPHEDGGAPATFYDRYHIMLQNGPGSLFHCGDETVTMKAGDVWHFDNTKTHSVINNSRDDRITLIADIRVCK
jgi:hypothetical protein